MKVWVLRVGALGACGVVGVCPNVAQEQGYWRAESTTARAITGDVTLAERRVTINFASFTIAEIRDLTPVEMAAAFDGESPTDGARGHLYRLSIPGDKRFLHKNTMCGAEETQWMVTLVRGKGLRLAFFSGAAMPVLTAEAVANTTSLCGTFGYSR